MTGAFDKLARPVQKWVRGQGWRELRDIQARAVHAIADSDGDVIVSATTAGGKTEAAFLPLISGVLDAPDVSPGFDLVYVGPLRALISDQARRLEEICAETGLPVVPWHGDISASIKSRALRNPRGILLITPESLEALLVRRGTEIGRLFGATRAVVLDELHSVLDSERGVQLRSLLTRLEIVLNRRIRRIGLSATLGDMTLACRYMRPDAADEVTEIEADGSAELQIQLRGYLAGGEGPDSPSATDAIAAHLFERLRGSDNLVFAGARQNVEIYADRLREMCEREGLPQEFYPHHASLSRDHRAFVEQRLKDKRTPTTAVCTSTLELGIDIGDVTCVAQIGAPFNVAGLRQRLGRSGRREGQPAILRQYAVEVRLEAKSHFADRLRLGLVRAIAMIELLIEKWCEPPSDGALHLSTLVHQVLAVIAERGGISAGRLFRILCQDGPFRQVDATLFVRLLRAIGPDGSDLIEQTEGSLLLLGPVGEKLVEHYSFYAVFPTPEEYRLVAEGGKELGTLPVDNVLSPGMMVIFSGRRWLVRAVHAEDRVIEVAPAKAGAPPRFGGAPGIIHDRVIDRMFSILEGDDLPLYLDGSARDLLSEAREGFRRLTLDRSNIIQEGEKTWVLATRVGTIRTTTLALALQGFGFNVETHDGFLEVVQGETVPDLRETLAALAHGAPVDLFTSDPDLVFEKYHRFLTKDLLRLDALSSRLAAESVPETCARILSVPSA